MLPFFVGTLQEVTIAQKRLPNIGITSKRAKFWWDRSHLRISPFLLRKTIGCRINSVRGKELEAKGLQDHFLTSEVTPLTPLTQQTAAAVTKSWGNWCQWTTQAIQLHLHLPQVVVTVTKSEGSKCDHTHRWEAFEAHITEQDFVIVGEFGILHCWWGV